MRREAEEKADRRVKLLEEQLANTRAVLEVISLCLSGSLTHIYTQETLRARDSYHEQLEALEDKRKRNDVAYRSTLEEAKSKVFFYC